MTKTTRKGLFDHLTAIYTDQSVGYFDALTPDDQKSYSSYMINRLISMNPDYVTVVNELQQFYSEIDNRTSYLFYSQLLPKGRQFHKYIKGVKDDQYEDWLVTLVRDHFCVSKREAVTYLDLYTATQPGRDALRILLESYGTPLKLIRKVL